jgi:hypothetical protein
MGLSLSPCRLCIVDNIMQGFICSDFDSYQFFAEQEK